MVRVEQDRRETLQYIEKNENRDGSLYVLHADESGVG